MYGAIVPPATLSFDLKEIRPSPMRTGSQSPTQTVAAQFGHIQGANRENGKNRTLRFSGQP
ncbi:hypothetical protein PPUN12996_49580 [Pseudomonas putida]|nr:hypothetical protein PPUN12996_49580 [Pseudomonas putida]